MKLRSIEAARGLAALSVVVAHCDGLIGGNPDLPFGQWHSFRMPGTAGVAFFFVLSGFVMAVAHGDEIGRGGDVGRFLWKRFCRIYPLYWLALAVQLHKFWLAPSLTPGAIAAWLSLLPVRMDNLLVVAWTLRQEVTFYLVLAVCLVAGAGRWLLAAWVAATVAWWTVLPQVLEASVGGAVLAHVLSSFNFMFFAGLLAGWLLPRWPAGQGADQGAGQGASWALLAAGAGVVLWRMSLDGWGAVYGPIVSRPVYGAGYGAVILGLAALERDGGLRFGPRGAALAMAAGALSYPLYLSHLLVIDAVAHWIGPPGLAARLGPGLVFAVLLAAALAVAAALAAWVDRPMARLLRRVSAGNTLRRPAPG